LQEVYVTLAKEGISETVVKKSVFIGHAAPVKTESEALEYIAKYKKQYSDATHNVWAYLIKNGNLMRYTDDGEPSGTSGIPVLDIIRKGGFTDAVIVVTRYFGGTLLGTGGLVRAYSAAAKEAVDNAGLASFRTFAEIIVEVDYQTYQKLKNYLKHPSVIVDDTAFSDTVTVQIAVLDEDVDSVCKDITEMSAGRAVIEKMGERLDSLVAAVEQE
jgi:uncharacterized YigZ family protein